ncbi:phage tail assembly chaperone [Qipengyuania sp. XHP0207]|uniref:phage tail assembly chaperone n=1 Tax=Qipengyuania sp. XHP0207 TaxID=3038078 RepID=UPI00242004D7|nr:phage tail assembly chaperone [Qipengyuania sp. XHP0207]MDG5748244.1 phage tail assembly chaperone [Qipengyuania sp. XHP0207]
MSERFAEMALRCAGLAATTLHWTPDTFWNATPAELLASLAPPRADGTPPTRDLIARMIERDENG